MEPSSLYSGTHTFGLYRRLRDQGGTHVGRHQLQDRGEASSPGFGVIRGHGVELCLAAQVNDLVPQAVAVVKQQQGDFL